MKIKNKGKVYPSPSPSPSPSSSSSFSSSSSVCSNAAGGGGGGGGGGLDYLSVLKLLPAAIIALASVLPLEDREVLAYLIMRSMKTTVPSSFSGAAVATNPPFSQKKPSKKSPNNSGSGSQHKAPGLYCDCFDCYTSFWFRWDSSSNRELIHQAIEAFEDHLTSGESEKSKKNGKGKRRDKTARRFAADNNNNNTNTNNKLANVIPDPGPGRPESSVIEKQVEMTEETSGSTVFVAAAEVSPVSSPERESGSAENNEAADITIGSSPDKEELTEVVRSSTATSCSTHHKGLARKVLPDVLGLFNSRLWSLWSPNV